MKPTNWILAFGLLVASVQAFGQAKEITLEEAVRHATEHSPELQMFEYDIEKAKDAKAGAIGQLLPRLTLDANIQFWDKRTDVEFIDPASLPGPGDLGDFGALIPQSFFDKFTDLAKPQTVQERITGAVNIQAVMPLTPLYSLAHLYRLQGASVEAAKFERLAKRDEVVYQTTDLFLKLMSAIRMLDVTSLAIEQVEAHLKMAKFFQQAGFVGLDDVLRAEAALAKIKDQHAQVESGVAMARAALNVKMGMPIDDDIVPVGDFPDPPAPLTVTETELVEKALNSRPERLAVEQKVKMASAGKQAAIGALIPTIAAVFRYTHFQGSKFQRENSAFVGAVLQWDFWNWGATWFRMKEVSRDHEKALKGLELARDGIMLDVRKAWLDLKQASLSIEALRSQIEFAQENLRVVTKKYEASTATSVEVLDAQSTLTQAKAGYQVALLNYYIAFANLQRATAGSI